MKTIPIAFAFDDKLLLPASVCISSLLANALPTTFYDIYILHPSGTLEDKRMLNAVAESSDKCKITYIKVEEYFKDGFEVRGITKATYYRLLLPRLITDYSKIIYADVDIIFRMDLSELYDVNLDNLYLAGTYDVGMLLTKSGKRHILDLGLECDKYIQAGLLVLNCQKIREDELERRFFELYKNNYMFQDQDILNLVCAKRHLRLPMKYNMTDYSFILHREGHPYFKELPKNELTEAMDYGNLHFNGHKPWVKFALNFDVWWEYYRNSPVYDPEYYVDFYYSKLNELDQLSLWKRVKVLLRYFVYGKRKI